MTDCEISQPDSITDKTEPDILPQEKPNSSPKNGTNLARPHFPFQARRGWPGRCLSRRIRPIARPWMGPGFPMQHAFHPGHIPSPMQYQACFLPPGGLNPAFATGIPSFPHRPPIPAPSQGQGGNGFNNFQATHDGYPDVWIEAMASGGRKFYFNSKTREVTWEKPLHSAFVTMNDNGQVEQVSSNMSPRMRGRGYTPRMVQPFPSYHHVLYPPPPGTGFPQPGGCVVLPNIHAALDLNHANAFIQNQTPDACVIKPPARPFINQASSGDQTSLPETGGGFSMAKSNVSHQSKASEGSSYSQSRIADWSKTDSKTSLDFSSDESSSKVSSPIPKPTASPIKPVTPSKHTVTSVSLSEQTVGPGISGHSTKLTLSPQISCTSSRLGASPKASDTPTKLAARFEALVTPTKLKASSGTVKELGSSPDESLLKQTTFAKTPPKDKTRPVSSSPVSGTCWSVVWTGDERVFFYDMKRKMSVWDRPRELLDRPDVDKLVEKPVIPQLTSTHALAGQVNSKKETVSELDGHFARLKTEEPCPIENNVIKKSGGKTYETLSEASFPLKDNVKKPKSGTTCTNLSGDSYASNDNDKKPSAGKSCKNLSEGLCLGKDNDKKQSADKTCEKPYVQKFFEMLEENNVSAYSSEKDLFKLTGDPRYTSVPTFKELRMLYHRFVLKKMEEEKERIIKELAERKQNFLALLEEAGVSSITEYDDFVAQFKNDARFKAIESEAKKENLFNEFVSEIIQKEKEMEDSDFEKRKNFIALLSEVNPANSNTIWCEVEEKISNDARYKAIQCPNQRENLFHEYVQKLSLPERFGSENQSNANFSEASDNSHSCESEQKNSQNIPSAFKHLLNELIKSPKTSWSAARSKLERDRRWENIRLMEYEKEELFKNHVQKLQSLKKNCFHALLDNMRDLALNSLWSDFKVKVMRAAELADFSVVEQECEKEFKEYLRLKFQIAAGNFSKLLQESTNLIQISSEPQKTDNFITDIEKNISDDKRYLALNDFPQERKLILLKHMIQLHAASSSTA